ncbi:hypothetical protein FRC03_010804 [Tulasnella sp. 419]|nr:hypothetical protein FRC03_010804 [Tulasnella sp. 419]
MTSKYANLPDIDTAKDIYETEDPELTTQRDQDSSDDENALLQKKRPVEPPSKEELDASHLPDRAEVGRMFRKAERRRPRKTVYTYPPSPDQSPSRSPSPRRGPPIQARLQALQHELAALESELSDPATAVTTDTGDDGEPAIDPGEMLKGLVEARNRLSSLSRDREILIERAISAGKIHKKQLSTESAKAISPKTEGQRPPAEVKTLAELDQRVAELEKMIGTSGASLDESSPLPPPLLPQINRLSNQITLLTQPRHIDSISRRLKLLLTDLEKLQPAKSSQRGSGANQTSTTKDGTGSTSGSTNLPPDIVPILTRLSPLLPTIPHLLQRLRTLSSLHTSASSFAATLSSLEEEQKKVRSALEELSKAVEGVEGSMAENDTRVEANVKGLEARLEEVTSKLKFLEGT